MDLAEFLLARIAEDEAANRRGPEPESWCDRGEGLHFSYERMAAECEAKRRIVAIDSEASYLGGQSVATDMVLRALAMPYADHPDYNPEWKP